MSKRAWYGVIGGGIPIYLDDFDQWGLRIDCGAGLSADLTHASAARDSSRFLPRLRDRGADTGLTNRI